VSLLRFQAVAGIAPLQRGLYYLSPLARRRVSNPLPGSLLCRVNKQKGRLTTMVFPTRCRDPSSAEAQTLLGAEAF